MVVNIKLKRPNARQSALMVEFMRNRTSFKFYTGKTVHVKNWLPSKQMVSDKEENHELVNLYLENWMRELKRIIANLEANQIRLDKAFIQTQLDRALKVDKIETSNLDQINDFASFMESCIDKRKAKKRNFQRLIQCKRHVLVGLCLISQKKLKEWNNLSSKQKSALNLKADHKLHFDDVNLNFIQKFRDYMYTAKYRIKTGGRDQELNYKVNYIEKQIITVKQFVSMAIEEGYVKPFTWKSVKSESRQVDSVYTDFKEIQCLYDHPLEKKNEILVRDKYVLNCFLGLRYSDLNKLEPHFFRKSTIGNKELLVYSARAKKTDYRVEFAVHPIAARILEKYNYRLPTISAKEFNDVLKIVSFKAGLRNLERIRIHRGTETITNDIPKYKLMSSHAGRRSFCTNFYNEGVSIAAIMSISGHQTEHEFRKYIKKGAVRLDLVAEQVFSIKGIDTSPKVA